LTDCIRCDTCVGYPCLVHGKADADINDVRPVKSQKLVTMITGAKATLSCFAAGESVLMPIPCVVDVGVLNSWGG
jgi:hypothetical protein